MHQIHSFFVVAQKSSSLEILNNKNYFNKRGGNKRGGGR